MKNLHVKMILFICLIFSLTISNANTSNDGICSTPYMPSATVTGLTTATVSWSATSGAVKYKLRYRVANSNDAWQEITVFGTSVNLTGLTANSLYIYQLKTVCPTENSAWYIGTFNNAQCDAPSTTLVTLLSQSSARISWEAVAGATKYKVRYRAMGGNWNTVYTQRLMRMLNGLSINTVYQYQVKSMCDVGWGDWTAMDSFFIDEDAFSSGNNARIVSDKLDLNIWPNPVANYLNIQVANAEVTEIQLYNANGQAIRIIQNNNQVDVSALAKGIYIVQVLTTEQDLLSQRFVKQ